MELKYENDGTRVKNNNLHKKLQQTLKVVYFGRISSFKANLEQNQSIIVYDG